LGIDKGFFDGVWFGEWFRAPLHLHFILRPESCENQPFAVSILLYGCQCFLKLLNPGCICPANELLPENKRRWPDGTPFGTAIFGTDPLFSDGKKNTKCFRKKKYNGICDSRLNRKGECKQILSY
jgi:hypothetical protein